jgi:hypothetical protein
MKTKTLITLMALLIVGSASVAQNSRLSIKGNLLDPLKDYQEVSLTVFVNNSEVHEVPLSRKGAFKIKIYPEEQYTLSFSREGWVEKIIEIDTRSPENIEIVGTIEFNVFMERQGRLTGETRLCANYFYSEDEKTLIYTTPENEDYYLAFTEED